MELSGKVIAVLDPRSGVSKTGNPWMVQEYVIETHDQYPRKMCFDVFGEDKIKQFNGSLMDKNIEFKLIWDYIIKVLLYKPKPWRRYYGKNSSYRDSRRWCNPG